MNLTDGKMLTQLLRLLCISVTVYNSIISQMLYSLLFRTYSTHGYILMSEE